MKKTISALMIYGVLFALVFLFSIFDYLNGTPIIKLGLPALTLDLGIAFFALIGLGKSVWHIIQF